MTIIFPAAGFLTDIPIGICIQIEFKHAGDSSWFWAMWEAFVFLGPVGVGQEPPSSHLLIRKMRHCSLVFAQGELYAYPIDWSLVDDTT